METLKIWIWREVLPSIFMSALIGENAVQAMIFPVFLFSGRVTRFLLMDNG